MIGFSHGVVLLSQRSLSASRRARKARRLHKSASLFRSTQFHATTSNAPRRAASRRGAAHRATSPRAEKKRSAFPREIASCAPCTRPGLLASHYLLSASRRPSCDNRADACECCCARFTAFEIFLKNLKIIAR